MGWEEIFHTKGNHKNAGIAIFISEKKIDFKTKNVTRDKEEHYVMNKVQE